MKLTRNTEQGIVIKGFHKQSKREYRTLLLQGKISMFKSLPQIDLCMDHQKNLVTTYKELKLFLNLKRKTNKTPTPTPKYRIYSSLRSPPHENSSVF